MVSGHAQYAKGCVEETVGKALGSKDWEESGEKDSAAGVEEMKVRPKPEKNDEKGEVAEQEMGEKAYKSWLTSNV